MNNSVLRKATQALSILLLLKVFAKIVDFTLNILVIRNIDQEVYGLTIYFGLFTNLTMFYAKICLKPSYLKRSVDPQSLDDPQKINEVLEESARNLMYLGVGVTVLLSAGIGVAWVYLYGHLHPQFALTTVLFGVGAFLESSAEPNLVASVLNFEYKVTAKNEAVAIFSKTLFLYLFIRFSVFDQLVCFGAAQIVFSAVLYVASLMSLQRTRNFLPQKIKDGKEKYYVHKGMLDMGWQFTLISFLKFLQQELEKLVMINFNKDPKSSAEYTLVSNLGSMVPRYLYAPLEEISANLFAKLSQKNDPAQGKESLQIFSKILKFIHLIGFLAVVFGLNYSRTLVAFLYGDRWNTESCVRAMQAYSVYIYVMGVNGISEAFLYGSINKNQMSAFRYAILISTSCYLLFSMFLINYGAFGLIQANILSMLIRIFVCFCYMKLCMLGSDSVWSYVLSTFPEKPGIYILLSLSFLTSYFTNEFLLSFSVFFQLALGAGNAGAIYILYGSDIRNFLTNRKG